MTSLCRYVFVVALCGLAACKGEDAKDDVDGGVTDGMLTVDGTTADRGKAGDRGATADRHPAGTEAGAGVENSDGLCSDGKDNDGDKHIDCDDYDCSKNASVTVCLKEDSNALCSDSKDNDGDTHVDCDDYDCSKNATVTVCSPTAPSADKCPGDSLVFAQKSDSSGAYYEANATGTFKAAANDYTSTNCLWDDGPDIVYHVKAPVPGRLGVYLDVANPIDGEVYVFVGSCGTGTMKVNCTGVLDCPPPGCSDLYRSFDGVVAGTDYYIVLDTSDKTATPTFTLRVVFREM